MAPNQLNAEMMTGWHHGGCHVRSFFLHHQMGMEPSREHSRKRLLSTIPSGARVHAKAPSHPIPSHRATNTLGEGRGKTSDRPLRKVVCCLAAGWQWHCSPEEGSNGKRRTNAHARGILMPFGLPNPHRSFLLLPCILTDTAFVEYCVQKSEWSIV